MEVVRMFLAYAENKNFKVYQMDVKSAFLNGELEKVYIEQPKGFPLTEEKDMALRTKESIVQIKSNTKNLVCKVGKILSKAWIC